MFLTNLVSSTTIVLVYVLFRYYCTDNEHNILDIPSSDQLVLLVKSNDFIMRLDLDYEDESNWMRSEILKIIRQIMRSCLVNLPFVVKYLNAD